MPVCYLIGAGDLTLRGLCPGEGDFVVAADDGYSSLINNGLAPDLLVGDFDSLKQIPQGVSVKTYPPEKDDTDMAIALSEGAAQGYHTFYFYGASGGRADHTLANIQLMGGASRMGYTCKMICPEYDIYTVTNDTLVLPEMKSGTIVSVFCHGDRAEGVTLEGLKYPLDKATLTCDRALGVSNEAMKDEARISVANGTLLVYVMH